MTDVAQTLRDPDCQVLYDRLKAMGFWMVIWGEMGGMQVLSARSATGKIRVEGRSHRAALEAAALIAEGKL